MRIIIDLSNLAYICLYGMQYKIGKDKYNKEIFLAICRNKIEAIKKATNAKQVLFAKDNYPARKLLDKQYKANRVSCKFPIKKDLIFMLKKQFNAKIFEAKNKEADDVMATMLKHKKLDCIVSTDHDLLQAINNGKQMFNPITMTFWTNEYFEKKYNGLKKFNDILWFKSFTGDSSDNIPKAGNRIPRKALVEIINNRKFKNWEQLTKIIAKSSFCQKIDMNRVKLNYKIVKLDKNCEVTLV